MPPLPKGAELGPTAGGAGGLDKLEELGACTFLWDTELLAVAVQAVDLSSVGPNLKLILVASPQCWDDDAVFFGYLQFSPVHLYWMQRAVKHSETLRVLG